MKWGNFSITHIISLLLVPVIFFVLYYVLRNKSNKTKTIVLFILSLTGISAIIFNLIYWKSPLEYLPLHMCSIQAMLIPVLVITKKNWLGNLLNLWSFGALIALFANYVQADLEIFSWPFVMYYFPHIFEFVVPLLLAVFKMVDVNKKYFWNTLSLTIIIYTVVHFCNVIINDITLSNTILDKYGEIIKVNYMYSVYPANPLLELFYRIIPLEYFYIFLATPLVVLYLFGLYKLLNLITKKIEKNKEKDTKNLEVNI